MKRNRKLLLVTSMITILPVFAGLILWKQLPEQMPTHFGADGTANGYSSRAFAVFVPYLICLGAHLLCAFATQNDPRKQAISQKIYALILLICPFVSIICGIQIYGYVLGIAFTKSARFWVVIMGLIFVAVGNYLPKCRRNYTVGIKIPWTLASEENWDATHRLAGKLWMAGGILDLLLAVQPWLPAFLTSFVIMIVISMVPMIYSYVYYKKMES